MFRSPFAAVLFATAGVLISHAQARADAVDDYVNAEIQKRNIPGLSLAVVRDAKVVKAAAYGKANVELDVPVTTDTVFQIQSITKTFTSAAILSLVEEGRIALNDPISKYLDGTPDTWKEITIRHLLSHTSGIKDFINEPTASIRLDASEEEVLKATAPRPLNFQPGDKYAYSNTNYHLLAMVIRKLTGKYYGDFLQERIFKPLGMTSTRIQDLSAIIPHRASGYGWSGGKLRNGEYVAQSILSYGGGGVLSTAPDMARWAIALESEKILKRATFDEAWTPAKFNNGNLSGYGLGWGVDRVNGHRFVSHSGGHITGFTSNLIFYRDDHLAVIVLTNAGHANPGAIAQHVAGLYIPELKPRAAKAIEDKEPKVTALLREIGAGIHQGELNQDQFTPNMWAALAPQLDALKTQSHLDGDLKSVELLSKNEQGGQRFYRYRMISANKTHLVTLVLDKDDKVAGLWAEEE